MSKTTIILATVFVVVTATTIIASFNVETLSRLLPTPKPITSSKQTSPTSQPKKPALSLPITATSSAVKSATVTYTFEGVLKEVNNYQDSSRSAELITNIETQDLKGFKGKKVPRFMTNKNTRYVFLDKGKERAAEFTDLQPGKKIRIRGEYDLIKKNWSIPKVSIIIPTPKSSLSK